MAYRRRATRRYTRSTKSRQNLKRRYSQRGSAITRRVKTLERKVGRKLTYFVSPFDEFRIDGQTGADAVYIKPLMNLSTWVAMFPGNVGIDDDCFSLYHRGMTLRGNLRWTPEEGTSLSQSLNIITHIFIVSPRLHWDGQTMTNGLHYRAVDNNAIVYMNLKYYRVHAYKKIMTTGYEPAYVQKRFKMTAKGVGAIYSPDQPLGQLTSSGDPKDNLYALFFSNIVGGTSTERPNLDVQMEGLHKVYTHYQGAAYT